MQLYKRSLVPVGHFRPVLIAAALAITVAAGTILWQDVRRMQQQTERLNVQSNLLAELQRNIDKEKRTAQLAQKAIPDGFPSETAISTLKRIEAAWSEDISLLRVQTDMTKGRMQLQISAKSRDALFGFVDRLEDYFGDDVFLQNHIQQATNNDEWLLDASLVLGWK